MGAPGDAGRISRWLVVAVAVVVLAAVAAAGWIRWSTSTDGDAAWTREVPGARDLLGSSADRIAVKTSGGVVVLSRDDGEVVAQLDDPSARVAEPVDAGTVVAADDGVGLVDDTGTWVWRHDDGFPAAFGDGVVTLESPGDDEVSLTGVDAGTGQELWSRTVADVADDVPMASYERRQIEVLVDDADARDWHLLDASSGEIVAGPFTSPGLPAVAGDTAITTTSDGPCEPRLVRAGQPEKSVVWLSGAPARCTIIPGADGYVWILSKQDDDHATVYALDIAVGAATDLDVTAHPADLRSAIRGTWGERTGRWLMTRANGIARIHDGKDGSVTWEDRKGSRFTGLDVGPHGVVTIRKPSWWEREIGGVGGGPAFELRSPGGDVIGTVRAGHRSWDTSRLLDDNEWVALFDETVVLLR